jgi:hypothetical protein
MTAIKAITLTNDREPWERQNTESPRMFARFTCYRDLGDTRTLNAALEIINATTSKAISKGTLHQISCQYRWTERAESYDNAASAAERTRLLKLRRDMIERHRKLAAGLTSKAVDALRSLAAADLEAVDITRFLTVAADLERKALGEPTERVALSGPTGSGPVQFEDMGRLTPEQRRVRLGQIASELARRAGRDVLSEDEEGE